MSPTCQMSNIDNLRDFRAWLACKQSNNITRREAKACLLKHIWFCQTGVLVIYLAFAHTHAKHTCTHDSEPLGKNLIKVMQYSSHTRRRHVLPRGATLPLKYSLFPESRAASWPPLPQTQGNWPTALCVHFNTSMQYEFATTLANDGWCPLFYDSVQRCPQHTLTL